LAHELNVPIKKYQHHKAHFAAVLGEHDLLDSDAPILGVIWDGTGLGDDNEIWGGEFFTYHNDEIIRRAHIEYFDFITADKMPREPRISALAATAGIEGTDRILREKFSDLEWKNYQTLLQKSENLQTSSMGRLFDAVSALLGLKDCSSYEGEAAMLLEKEARDYLVIENKVAAYPVELTPNNVSTTAILQSVVDDILEGNAAGLIAARFHRTLVEIIKRMAEELNLHRMAFSGGVFQNALLVDLIIEKLGDDYTLYFHKKLSPNDENISFGQLMCHHIEG
jgi:hydrogenase maturation protein HypF